MAIVTLGAICWPLDVGIKGEKISGESIRGAGISIAGTIKI
jgi:hypothetical protein